MKLSFLVAILAVLGLLLLVNQWFGASVQVGGLPWPAWAAIIVLIAILGLFFALLDAERMRLLLTGAPTAEQLALQQRIDRANERRQLDQTGPDYPHPFILKDKCIACDACIEACPHDVLSMVKENGKGVASVVRRDLCMEDTSCETACPVEACIVLNSTRKIRKLPKPERHEETFMTNVPGCYVIGDVSGVPLIKNAANEGAKVMAQIAIELQQEQRPPEIKLDVIVIGMGPAGLSAILAAKQVAGLTFLGLEQDSVLATIESYPENKYVNFKPDDMQPLTLLAIEGEGTQREVILGTWKQALTESGVRYLDDAAAEQVNVIHQYESCTKVERVKDSNHFIVHTNKGSYKTRRVVLAIGLRGTPKQLGDADHPVPGEEIEIERKFNGEVRRGRKVMYKLREPAQFRGLKLLVVGGGNSAVETAVDLVAARNSNEIDFLSANEINSVTLLIRSDFTKDVKFGNKRQIYQCIDQDKVKVRRGLQVKEIRAREVVIEDLRTRVTETLENDYVFAMIGGEPPKKFLEEIGIHVPKADD